ARCCARSPASRRCATRAATSWSSCTPRRRPASATTSRCARPTTCTSSTRPVSASCTTCRRTRTSSSRSRRAPTRRCWRGSPRGSRSCAAAAARAAARLLYTRPRRASSGCVRSRSLLLASLIAALAAAGARAADLPEIKARGTLRVLVMPDATRPEFYSLKPGSQPGFDAEMLDGFAKLQRLKLEVVPQKGWDQLIPALLDKRGDLIAGRFTATEGRRKVVLFTSEVFPSRNVVINRKPKKPVLTLEQLKAEKVGTNKGSSM